MLRLQYMILADFFREGQHGKFDLLGPFDRLYASQVPASHQALSVVIMLVADTEDGLGKHKFVMRCKRPNGQPLFEQRGDMVVKPEQGSWLGSVRFNFAFKDFPLPEYGKYRFEFEVDGKIVATHPLAVLRPQPGQFPGKP